MDGADRRVSQSLAIGSIALVAVSCRTWEERKIFRLEGDSRQQLHLLVRIVYLLVGVESAGHSDGGCPAVRSLAEGAERTRKTLIS